MMKLWDIYYRDADHETEHVLFVHGDQPRPSTKEAREYLLSVDGLIGRPEELVDVQVYAFDTAHDLQGNPYYITVEE